MGQGACPGPLKCMHMIRAATLATCWHGCTRWEGPRCPYAVQVCGLRVPKHPSSYLKKFLLSTRCIVLQAQDFAAALQALASERELLVSLFGEDVTGEGSQASRRGNEQWPPCSSSGPLMSPRSNGMPHVAALLDRVFESICRPLKVRL